MEAVTFGVLTTHLDDADLQSQFSDRVHPIPAFSYEECQYQGKSFGIITVPPRRIGPCVPVKRLGNMLLERQVYFPERF